MGGESYGFASAAGPPRCKIEWWLVTLAGGWQSCFSNLWTLFGVVLGALGVALESIWTSLGGSWGPLCSHWVSVGYLKSLRGHFFFAWAPIWQVLVASWLYFSSCHFGCPGKSKCMLQAIMLMQQHKYENYCFLFILEGWRLDNAHSGGLGDILAWLLTGWMAAG